MVYVRAIKHGSKPESMQQKDLFPKPSMQECLGGEEALMKGAGISEEVVLQVAQLLGKMTAVT